MVEIMGEDSREPMGDVEKEVERKRLEAEIGRLTREAERLERLRNMKLQILATKIMNVPKKFAADHPIMSLIGRYLGKGALALGKGTVGAVNELSKPKNQRALKRASEALLGKEKKGKKMAYA